MTNKILIDRELLEQPQVEQEPVFRLHHQDRKEKQPCQ